jgi:hypothetical protein
MSESLGPGVVNIDSAIAAQPAALQEDMKKNAHLILNDPAVRSILLIAYGIGHRSVIVLGGTSTGLVQRYLNGNEKSKGAVISKRMCGGLVIVGGLYLIYVAP